jgi:hypothetical protein
VSLAERAAAAAPSAPRILLFDLERLPGEFTMDVWEPRDLARLNYLHPDRWTVKPRTLMASWVWYGERRANVVSAWDNPDDPYHVARTMRDVMHQADTYVTFNGRKADLKWLRQDWAAGQIPTPRPVRDVDLYVAARSAFSLESKSLAYLAAFLGLPGKQGRYNAAEAKAAALADGPERRRLVRYSKQDSRLMVPVLDRMRPFLKHGPNLGLPYLDDERRCPVCGGSDLTRDGWATTDLTSFAAYQCACGAWSRSKHRRHAVTQRRVVGA